MLYGLIEAEKAYPALTDRPLRAAGKGRKRHTAKVLTVQAVGIPEPSGFERIRLEPVRDESATSMIHARPRRSACQPLGPQESNLRGPSHWAAS